MNPYPPCTPLVLLLLRRPLLLIPLLLLLLRVLLCFTSDFFSPPSAEVAIRGTLHLKCTFGGVREAPAGCRTGAYEVLRGPLVDR